MSIAINKWVRSVFRVLLLIDLCRAELGVTRRWQVKHPTSYSVMSVTMISNYCISQQASLTWVTRVPCECMGTSCTDRHGSYATCPYSNHAWQWPYRDYGVHLLSDHLVTRDTCELCIKKAVVREQEYLPTEQTSWFLNRKVTSFYYQRHIVIYLFKQNVYRMDASERIMFLNYSTSFALPFSFTILMRVTKPDSWYCDPASLIHSRQILTCHDWTKKYILSIFLFVSSNICTA